jgi:hypothetical protein
LPNLVLENGYLVRKDADPSLPLQQRAESAIPGITYASMLVSVKPLDPNAPKPKPPAPPPAPSSSSSSSTTKKKKS